MVSISCPKAFLHWRKERKSIWSQYLGGSQQLYSSLLHLKSRITWRCQFTTEHKQTVTLTPRSKKVVGSILSMGSLVGFFQVLRLRPWTLHWPKLCLKVQKIVSVCLFELATCPWCHPLTVGRNSSRPPWPPWAQDYRGIENEWID